MFRYGCLAAVLVAVPFTRPVVAQQTQPAYPCDAVISGDDVYVRSGAGSNFYPTTKLRSGDSVRVLGEQFGWVKIAPPQGSFSYVDMSMVDKLGAKQGKVKVENLRVYAGSTLSPHKREVQHVLAKDAMVEILGEADGFYKITPPPGAVLWISGQFVKRPGESGPLVKAAGKATPSSQPFAPGGSVGRIGKTAPRGASSTPGRPDATVWTSGADAISRDISKAPSGSGDKVTVQPAAQASDRWAPYLKGGANGERLASAETALRKLLASREFTRSQLEDLRKQYQAIAEQTEEPVAAAIAGSRIKQLQDRIDILAARERLIAERMDLDIYRAGLGQERQGIMRQSAAFASQTELSFKGELRISMLFPASMGRYRLADPTDSETTLAYVDVPENLRDAATRLLGQMVVVRAASQSFNQNLRVPVALASALVPTQMNAAAPSSRPAGVPKSEVVGQPNVDEDKPVKTADPANKSGGK